ncbi:MAG: DUF4272 domain-containing protein [Saprospiraceae bacterium]|nr:DUF4272 domain-containing protein [Saprospiraceae bacterium]
MDKRIRLKNEIEAKLIKYGIQDREIKYLPYLDFNPREFQQPKDVAKRAIILGTISNVAKSFFRRRQAKNWLKKEQLWEVCTETEQSFLNAIFPSQQQQIMFSWAIEAAMVLSWTINKIDQLPQIIEEFSESNYLAFLDSMPKIGDSTSPYINSATYRDYEAIFKENIVNELATTYFRDLLFSGAPDTTNINRGVSFERHKALNWVRQFSGIKEWDHTDTST